MKDNKNKQQQQPQQQPSGKQPTGQHPTGKDPSRKSQQQPHKGDMGQPMDVHEGDRRGDIENPDQQEQPGKKINIDDDPDQTKKKVPNMHK
jgi:hypothetical protein